MQLLRRYLAAPEKERTPVVRAIAEVLVEVRGSFRRPDNSPDWRGRTNAYQAWIAEAYGEAGIPADKRASLQSLVGYHLGSALRKQLDAETLEEYGLAPETPKDRSNNRRRRHEEVVKALTSGELTGGAVMAITAALTVLKKATPRALDELDAPTRRVAIETLADIEQLAAVMHRRARVGPPAKRLTALEFQPAEVIDPPPG